MSEYGFLSIDEVQRALSEGVSPHVVLNVNHEASEVADEAEHTATPAASKPDLLQALASVLTALAEAGEEPDLEYDHIDCVSGTVWWGSPLWTVQRREEEKTG